MDKTNKKEDKSTWAIGGGVLIRVGAGFLYKDISFRNSSIYTHRDRLRSDSSFYNFKKMKIRGN